MDFLLKNSEARFDQFQTLGAQLLIDGDQFIARINNKPLTQQAMLLAQHLMSNEEKDINILKLNFTKNKIIVSGNLKGQYGQKAGNKDLLNEIRSLLLLGEDREELCTDKLQTDIHYYICYNEEKEKQEERFRVVNSLESLSSNAIYLDYEKVMKNPRKLQSELKRRGNPKEKLVDTGKDLEMFDVIKCVMKLIKRLSDERFESTNLQVKYYRAENEDINLAIEDAIYDVYGATGEPAANPEQILSIDLGTGYYLAMQNSVADQYEEFKNYIFVKRENDNDGGTSKVQTASENKIDGKKSSAIYFFTELQFPEVPRRIYSLRTNDQLPFSVLIQNTSIERIYAIDQASIEDSLWYSISHYKKYLYYTKNVIVDKLMMTSNVHVYHERSNRCIDLLHIFLVFAAQLYYVISDESDHTAQKIKYDTIRISVPINAEQCHKEFMETCFDYVFNSAIYGSLRRKDGSHVKSQAVQENDENNYSNEKQSKNNNNDSHQQKKLIKIQITTEPESAFSFISQANNAERTNKNEQDETEDYLMDNFNHAVLIDGGDGTFDYLYVRKFKNVWSRQEQGAYNFAGSNIFDQYKNTIFKYCDKKFQDTKLFYTIYDEIKTHLATKENEKVLEIRASKSKDSYGYSILMRSCYEQEGLRNYLEIRNGKNDKQNPEEAFAEFTKYMEEYEAKKKQVDKSLPPQQIQRILMENNATMDSVFKRHIQNQNIIVKADLLNEITNGPTRNFQDNYKDFLKRVDKRIDKQRGEAKTDAEPLRMAHIFVGGLASSKTIAGYMKETFQEYSKASQQSRGGFYDFITVMNPQVSIIRGIPIQRANISLRDYTQSAPYYLYLLVTGEPDRVTGKPGLVTEQSRVQYEDPETKKWIDFMRPEAAGGGGRYQNLPCQLLQRGEKLEPGRGRFMRGLTLRIGGTESLTFYKSKNEAPHFFELQGGAALRDGAVPEKDGRIGGVIPRNCFRTYAVQVLREQLSEEAQDRLCLDDYIVNATNQIQISVEVFLQLDHVSFEPDPQVVIYGHPPDEYNPVPIYKIPIWDWVVEPIAGPERKLRTKNPEEDYNN